MEHSFQHTCLWPDSFNKLFLHIADITVISMMAKFVPLSGYAHGRHRRLALFLPNDVAAACSCKP